MGADPATTFGQLLRHFRLRSGLSQERLAERAELSVNQISDMERDRRARPHPDTLRRLADALDLSGPEREVFVARARPSRTAPLPPLQPALPLPLTTFFPRPDDAAALQRLRSVRLLTLIGPGGVGKTRMALELAHAVARDYPDGVWLVNLEALRESELVPQAVGRALGVSEQTAQPVSETLVRALRERRLLLVLDNCEHLLDACAGLLELLLRRCPWVRALATSREALRIGGEALWPIEPLAVPLPATPPTVEAVGACAAVRLFVDRAEAVLPGFALKGRNVAMVAAICRGLDGLPLALELAAARVATMPIAELAARLDDRFRLLTEGSRVERPRHQTLRAALEWSDALLSEPERALLWRLSVFAGGWTLAATEGVAAGGELSVAFVATVLAGLAAKSLVRLERSEERVRYGMLETIRQYAAEHLASSGEAAVWQGRHADYFLALAEEAGPALDSAEGSNWLGRLEAEHDNLRAALRWLIDEGASVLAVRLAGALGPYWDLHQDFREGRQWLEEALMLQPLAPDWVRARALQALGEVTRNQGDYATARAALEEGKDLFARLGDRRGLSMALRNLGIMAVNQEPPDFARATVLFEECLEIRHALNFQLGVVVTLNDLGGVALEQGDYARARQYFADVLSRARALSAEGMVTIALANLGIIGLMDGEDARARALFAEALGLVVLPEDSRVVAYALAALAGLASRAGRPEQAARLAGASEGVCAGINFAMPAPHRARFDRQAAAARAQLDEAAWAAAWMAGFTLTAEQALRLALTEG